LPCSLNYHRCFCFSGSRRSISPSRDVTVGYGDYLQFTITPNTGYQIEDVLVDEVSQGPVNIYTFTNITENHSIQAKFAKETFTVTIAEGERSRFPRWQCNRCLRQEDKPEIVPESEYIVPILLVNGQPVDATKSGKVYKFDLKVVVIPVYMLHLSGTCTSCHGKSFDERRAESHIHSEDGSVLTFNGITPYLELLQPEDVIISGVTEATPYGLLRKVTNVTMLGSQVIVETTEATLEDAFEEARSHNRQALTAKKITRFVPLRKGVTLQEAIPGPIQAQACLSLAMSSMMSMEREHNE